MRAALAAIAVLLCPTGVALARGPITETDLGEGRPRVVLAPRPSSKATLAVVFSAGAVDDLDQPGLTRLTQQAMLVANQRQSYEKLYLQLFRANASLRTETGITRSLFELTAQKQDFTALASMVLGTVLSPTLDPEGLPLARERAVRDATGGESRNGLLRLLASTIVDDWRYNNDTLGDKNSLESIPLDQVKLHLSGPLSPARATIILAGDFDEKKILAAIRAKKGGVKIGRRARPAVHLPITGDFRSWSEVHVLAYPVDLADARGVAAGRLLEALVNERLMRTLRQAGLGYSFSAFASRMPWLDMFTVVVPGHNESGLSLRQTLDQLLGEIKSGSFTDADLARNKSFVLAGMQRADEDPPALVAELIEGDAAPSWFGPEVDSAMEKLSLADVKDIAGRWFNEDKAARLTFSPNIVQEIPKTGRSRR